MAPATETAELLVTGGWLRTGDIGRLDESGNLHLVDRLKDMIISGGENVYTAEVERVIATHPAVREVAVYGVPDEKWGEAVKAAITVLPGQDATPDEIVSFTRDRLAHYKSPKISRCRPGAPEDRVRKDPETNPPRQRSPDGDDGEHAVAAASAHRRGAQTAVVPFATEIAFVGPLRSPAQMLDDQSDDGHPSVHDGDTAASLGLAAGAYRGADASQPVRPVGSPRWGGVQWFQHGCISSHFQTMVVEGEQVQASLTTIGPNSGAYRRPEGGTAPPYSSAPRRSDQAIRETELAKRRRRSGEPGELFIIDQLEVGMTFDSGPASISFDDPNGPSYPFPLADKVKRMTEPHPWYTAGGGRRHRRGVEQSSPLRCSAC